MTTQPSSSEVRIAALLMAVASGFGVLVLLLGLRLFTVDPGFLFAVLPMVASFLLLAGVFITAGAVGTALGLWQGRRGVRLHTAVVGGALAVSGVPMMFVVPLAGLLLTLYGGALVYLMSTPAAARDLGPWLEHVRPPAPWGSRPGTRLWSKEPAQHGPWAPDPTTLPWFSWKHHSGPRAPWWQTWQAGLSQGIPLWELVVLALALLLFLVGLVAVPFNLSGSHRLVNLAWHGSPLWLLPIPLAMAVVAWLEQRMRRRLAGRR